MPKSKKPATELTGDEIAARVFPQKAIQELKKIAQERGQTSSQKKSTR